MQDIESRIEDLLVKWETARQTGNPLNLEQLCAETPELRQQLAERIAVLHRLSWIDHPDLSVISNENDVDDTKLPDTELTVGEFVEAISDSGILSPYQVEQLKSETHNTSARAIILAEQLVQDGAITNYQAKVILERGDSPLLLDRYIILDSIGAGGMGVVFKALQQSLDRVVALKILPKHAVDSDEKRRRFQREMKSAAKLSHPNVVQAFDAYESNGVCFFAMEYIQGSDLQRLVADAGKLTPDHAVEIISQAAAGLACAHENGIIHRDVKPSNIMLDDDGNAKVMDLGLARTRDAAASASRTDLTQDGLGLGTAAYMSPEQAFDARQADTRSDVYSLGCTLYFLMHGKPLFDRPNSVQTVIAHRETPAPLLSQGRNDVTEALEAAFQKAVAKDPDQRFQSMSEFQEAILGDERPIESVPTTAGTSREIASPKHLRTKWARPVVIGTILLVIVAAVFIWRPLKSNKASARKIALELLDRDDVGLILDTPDGELIVDFAEELPESSITIAGVALYIDPDRDYQIDRFDGISSLRSMTLASEDKATSIAKSLAGLTHHSNLLTLQVTDCRLSENAIDRIAGLPNLRSIDFLGCNIPKGAVEKLSRLHALDELSFNGSLLSEENVRDLSTLQQITYLDLGNTDIHLDSLSQLSKLTDLVLSGIECEDFQPITGLTNLKSLFLDATNLADNDLKLLDSLNLTTLDVGHTKITSKGVRQIASMNKLEVLLLDAIPVQASIEEIAGFPNLATLSLDGTDLTDVGLDLLSRNRSISILYVSDTKVSNNAINRFQIRCPWCTVITDSSDGGIYEFQ